MDQSVNPMSDLIDTEKDRNEKSCILASLFLLFLIINSTHSNL